MKGTLIKRGEGDYKLFINDTPFGQSKQSPYNKLSLKNCQAIEHGYDLVELAEDFIRDVFDDKNIEIGLYNGIVISFIKGFQKALELLGDKKFSESDMRIAIEKGMEIQRTINDKVNIPYHRIKEYIQSLQQTEWEVFIDVLMTEREGGVVIETPKLDQNGCLILKRK